jgi:hypothetical protein
MTETDLQALERFVAENDELLELDEQTGRFNIFDALGIARVEIRHSNFLAWLLTPGESHGQGDLFLKSLLMDVFRKARQEGAEPPISPVELDGADLRGVDVRREWRNTDLLISCEELPDDEEPENIDAAMKCVEKRLKMSSSQNWRRAICRCHPISSSSRVTATSSLPDVS